MSQPATAVQPRRGVPNAVFAMVIFIVAEIMFFAALVSAFLIAEAGATTAWPPTNQPRLPVEMTAFTTLALLASGVLLVSAGRAFRYDPRRALRPLLGSMLLGIFFVTFQGIEWVRLIHEGLTLTTSTHGSFFYLIVGTHALHAIGAILGLVYVFFALRGGTLKPARFTAARIFWYFVVCVWPILYLKVYL